MKQTESHVLSCNIVGNIENPALITVPDILSTNAMCFHTFFAHPEAQFLNQIFCRYELSLPTNHPVEIYSTSWTTERDKDEQHTEDDDEHRQLLFPTPGASETLSSCSEVLVESAQLRGNFVTGKGQNETFRDLEEMALAAVHLIERMGVKQWRGMGVGAGAYVLIRMACVRPSSCKGLIVGSPVVTSPGWVEWAWGKQFLYRLRKMLCGEAAKSAHPQVDWMQVANEACTTHYSPDFTDYHHEELLRITSEHLRSTVPKALFDYTVAWYTTRKDLTKMIQKELKDIEVLIFVGARDGGDLVSQAIHLHSVIEPPGMSSWIKLSGVGRAVFEESPQSIAQPIMYWIAGQGYILHKLQDMNQRCAPNHTTYSRRTHITLGNCS